MLSQFAQMFAGEPWLIDPKAFRAMIARAEQATPEAIAAAVAAYGQRATTPTMYGDVAVIECCNLITYKASWFSMYFGGSSIEEMQAKFRTALADPAVRTIVFRWDTPGGYVTMVPEFADEIFAAAKKNGGPKPILSVCDTLCASAGVWLASQTDTIYVSASSQIGSIGVYGQHFDLSGMLEKAGVKVTSIFYGAHKMDGDEYAPLSDEAHAVWQDAIDELGTAFDGAMARGRGVSTAVVQEEFGQGLIFRGKKARAIGLADKDGTFQQVIARLTKGRAGAAAAARATVADPKATAATDVSADAMAGKTRKTGAGSRQEGCCATCSEACPCDSDETCPEDCPDCDDDCACKASAKASATVAPAAATDGGELSDADREALILSTE